MFSRIDALDIVANTRTDAVLVATCGATSRELASIADRPNTLYLLDSMGLTTSVALGLALAVQGPSRVVAIDGDGSLFMNLGSLATIGARRPENLTVIVLDNRVHGSAGNVPSHSALIDVGAVARSCGINVYEASNSDSLQGALLTAAGEDSANLVHVDVEPGNAPDIPFLLEDPVVLGRRFGAWLRQTHKGQE